MCLKAFIQRVEQRKLLLDLAVSFYTHTKEVIGSTNVKVCVTVAGCNGTVRTFFCPSAVSLDGRPPEAAVLRPQCLPGLCGGSADSDQPAAAAAGQHTGTCSPLSSAPAA